LEGEQFDELVEDIRIRGQLVPIVLHEGEILDGRNRARACAKLKLEPVTVEWGGRGSPTEAVIRAKLKTEPMTAEWGGRGSLTEAVIAFNLKRRHLTSAQRAAVGRVAVPLFEKENRDAQREAGKATGKANAGKPKGKALGGKRPELRKYDESRRSTAKAAKATGASESSIKAARHWQADVVAAVHARHVTREVDANALAKVKDDALRGEALELFKLAGEGVGVKEAVRRVKARRAAEGAPEPPQAEPVPVVDHLRGRSKEDFQAGLRANAELRRFAEMASTTPVDSVMRGTDEDWVFDALKANAKVAYAWVTELSKRISECK
jgi:hypothetical protein